MVGVADSKGALWDPDGIDVERLIELKDAGGSVIDCPTGSKLERDFAVDIECDIWIPAARPDVIREDNVDRLKAKLVVPGANIPMTAETEAILHGRGVLAVPDFIANAGGVICAAVEYHGGTQALAFETIEEKIRRNTELCLRDSAESGRAPRAAALAFAERRVRKAMDNRRWS
jgi:glutamate dehydrogenase (NAD(P)+)